MADAVSVHVLDLEHLGLDGAICTYVLPGDEPAIVDPGPATTFDTLRAGLGALGIGAEDLAHVLLTHVHLDHAGATGHVVESFPAATVHVHRDGALHMANPTRLVASTRRTFGEAHDMLWGETRPVPEDRIRAWEPQGPSPFRGLRPVSTPGHIAHHLAFLDEHEGTLFAGDSMGIILAPGAPTHPATPPPSVDLRAWEGTLEEIRSIAPERFGVTHFGLHEDPGGRAREMQRALHALEARVKAALAAGDEQDSARFEGEVRDTLARHVDREKIDRYFDMFGAATDWSGVRFYLERNP